MEAAAARAWARANASAGADGTIFTDWSFLPAAEAGYVRKITTNPYRASLDARDVSCAKLARMMHGLHPSATTIVVGAAV